MLRLLTDSHISPQVAVQLARRLPRLDAVSLQAWREGRLLHLDDAEILEAAAAEGRTLVTYDQRTMWAEVAARLERGRRHGGVIFVDDATISPADVGGLVRALAWLWQEHGRERWTDRTVYLRLPPPPP